MERRRFIKTCCYSAVGLPVMASILQSCGAIYYAITSREGNKITIAKSEFIWIKKDKEVIRDFVLVETQESKFPICLYKESIKNYSAALLKCTHRGCELNVGGGIYSCPCHGSEFTTSGQVLEGPAQRSLKTFITESDNDNIYIDIS